MNPLADEYVNAVLDWSGYPARSSSILKSCLRKFCDRETGIGRPIQTEQVHFFNLL